MPQLLHPLLQRELQAGLVPIYKYYHVYYLRYIRHKIALATTHTKLSSCINNMRAQLSSYITRISTHILYHGKNEPLRARNEYILLRTKRFLPRNAIYHANNERITLYFHIEYVAYKFLDEIRTRIAEQLHCCSKCQLTVSLFRVNFALTMKCIQLNYGQSNN